MKAIILRAHASSNERVAKIYFPVGKEAEVIKILKKAGFDVEVRTYGA